MRLLVTGGAGFIGSNFIRYILNTHHKYSVVNFDLLTYAGNLENLRDFENDPRYKFVKGNISNPKDVASAITGVDAIVHFAAESHNDRAIFSPADFVYTNVLGTQVLLDAASKNHIRFHHVSTDEVFGDLGPDEKPFNENTPYRPSSPYSASKAAADHLVRAYIRTFGLQATISNCSNNYGPYQFPEKLHGLFITNLIEGKRVPIYGDGMQIRDWLYVEDHCRAIDVILQKGKIGETYCVGGASEKTNLEITKEIIELIKKDESMIEYVKDRPGHDRRYAIDFSKIKNDLGWSPSVDFKEGMRRTVEWYLSHEAWWRHIKTGEYLEYYKKQYKDR